MQISRIELYRLVSASPLNKVAPRFGIMPTALAAVCKANEIPYPGSGYWTRKSLGMSPDLEPLPTTSYPETHTIAIEPQLPRVSRTRSPTRPEKDSTSEEKPHSSPEPLVQDTPASSKRPIKLHPIVAHWIAEHARRRREALASRDHWKIRSAPAPLSDLDHRRHNIVDALFRGLEARGATVSEASKGLLRVTIDGEKIDFQVREKNRQVRVPDDDERSSYLTQELIGTGRLVFAIRTYLRGPHNEEWRETDKNPLENQLSQIVDRLFEGAKILRDWHLEQEAEREHWRQEAARRAEQARLARQEELRRRRLGELARDWQTAGQIRALVTMMRANSLETDTIVEGKSLAEWLVWAEAVADALDPSAAGPSKMFSLIGSVKAEGT